MTNIKITVVKLHKVIKVIKIVMKNWWLHIYLLILQQ